MDKTRENFSIRMLHKLSLKIDISNATDNLYNCFEKRHLQSPLLKYMIVITKNNTLSIFGENQNNATLVQKFIYCERNIHMEVFNIIVVPQEQLRLKRTLALFAEHICWIVLIGVMMEWLVAVEYLMMWLVFISIIFTWSFRVAECEANVSISCCWWHSHAHYGSRIYNKRQKWAILNRSWCYFLKSTILKCVVTDYDFWIFYLTSKTSWKMSVTQYRPSVLQKHWSRIDAFSLQQLEKQIKDHKDIFKRTFLWGNYYGWKTW